MIIFTEKDRLNVLIVKKGDTLTKLVGFSLSFLCEDENC